MCYTVSWSSIRDWIPSSLLFSGSFIFEIGTNTPATKLENRSTFTAVDVESLKRSNERHEVSRRVTESAIEKYLSWRT